MAVRSQESRAASFASVRTARIDWLRARIKLVIDERDNRNRPRWTLTDAYEVRAALNELETLRLENRRMRRVLYRNRAS